MVGQGGGLQISIWTMKRVRGKLNLQEKSRNAQVRTALQANERSALQLLVIREHCLVEEGDGDADGAVCSGGEQALKLRAEHCECC